MHTKNIIYKGKPPDQAETALILLHGRGGSAHDILSLMPMLKVNNASVLAPQARNNSWYPESFLSPVYKNEPWLSGAINLLDLLVDEIKQSGITESNIYLIGFSQGACLALEYFARKGQQFGGIGALSGGLIGEKIDVANYKQGLLKTPVFFGASDPDSYIPVERVRQSASVLETLGANVLLEVYSGMGHTITPNEIKSMNKHLFYQQNDNV